MRDVMPDVDNWLAQGEQVALATVIQTWGSAPRGVGAKMALTASRKLSGSVSGGCVEGAVVEAGLQTLESGQPQLLHFGVADETAWDMGLACGGTIEVFVEPLDVSVYQTLRAALDAERLVASVTVVRGPDNLLGRTLVLHDGGSASGSLGGGLDEEAFAAARVALAEERPQRLELSAPDGATEPAEVFVNVLPTPPTLVLVGGVHVAIALASIARTLGYRTIVVDPRRAFGSQERFPHADRLIQAWPEEAFAQIDVESNTAIAMLTHDPKIDDPALQIALNSPAFYVGALGSQKTQAKRRQRLVDAGLTETQLARLHGPIGLDLGGRTPEEIALSVMAEIIAARHGHLPVAEPQDPVAEAG